MAAKKPTKAESPGEPGPLSMDATQERSDQELDKLWGIVPGEPDPPDPHQAQRIVEDFYIDAIEERREEIEKGNGEALLDALLYVCMSDMAMPNWLTFQVAGAIRRYTHDQVATLGEAFRVPTRKHIKAAQRKRRKSIAVFMDVRALHGAGVSISMDLYEVVGKKNGVTKREAQGFCKEWCSRLPLVKGNRSFESLSPELQALYLELKPSR